MRGLTLTQPWASLVAYGLKRIETRSWLTHYKGPLAIHAAKAMDVDALAACADGGHIEEALRTVLGISPHSAAERLPRGVILAVVQVYDCRYTAVYQGGRSHDAEWVAKISDQERAFGNYGPGRYGWLLKNIVRLPEPVPCRGFQQLWTVPADVKAQVEAQVERVAQVEGAVAEVASSG